jgi:hypothetical protein
MKRSFRERDPLRMGVLGIAFVVLLMVLSFNLTRFQSGTKYAAAFTEASGLKPNEDVRIAGVKVGKVMKVGLEGDHVKVTFRVGADHHQVDLAGREETAGRVVRQHRVRHAVAPRLVRREPRALEKRTGLVHPQVLQAAGPVSGGHQRERGAITARGQGSGVAVGQDAGVRRHERQPVLAHPHAGLGLLGGDGVGFGKRITALRVLRQHSPRGPAQVDRCRPRVNDLLGGRLDVGAERGGKGDAVTTGDTEQRSPAYGETFDRRHEGGNVTADERDLLVRQPGLVEEGDRGPLGRIEPAQRFHAPILPYSQLKPGSPLT